MAIVDSSPFKDDVAAIMLVTNAQLTGRLPPHYLTSRTAVEALHVIGTLLAEAGYGIIHPTGICLANVDSHPTVRPTYVLLSKEDR